MESRVHPRDIDELYQSGSFSILTPKDGSTKSFLELYSKYNSKSREPYERFLCITMAHWKVTWFQFILKAYHVNIVSRNYILYPQSSLVWLLIYILNEKNFERHISKLFTAFNYEALSHSRGQEWKLLFRCEDIVTRLKSSNMNLQSILKRYWYLIL